MTRAKTETLQFMVHRQNIRIIALFALLFISVAASAQKYPKGIVDKSIAVIGNEMIMISDLEEEVQMMRAQGLMSDRNARCEILESMMESKLFLMQSRLDSLELNNDNVESELRNRVDQIRTQLGGDEAVAEYFGKPIYKLRQEWRKTIEDQTPQCSSLTSPPQDCISTT